MEMYTESTRGVDKTRRYGWITRGMKGVLMWLDKSMLLVDPVYQRNAIAQKVADITANWSWVACGVIVVAKRGNLYYVIDGQHRVVSAFRINEITDLPCIVFEIDDVKDEAKAFLDLNTGRKPVSSLGKFKAMITSGDQTSIFVNNVLVDLGVSLKACVSKPGEMASVEWATRRAAEDRAAFLAVMKLAVELSVDMPIKGKLLDGLWYINANYEGGLADKRLVARLRQIGGSRLFNAATKAAAYYSRGGQAVWAKGMMEEVNRGLQKRFELGRSAEVS